MKMDSEETVKPADSPAASADVLRQLGLLTPELHDTMQQLDVMPRLQLATDDLLANLGC